MGKQRKLVFHRGRSRYENSPPVFQFSLWQRVIVSSAKSFSCKRSSVRTSRGIVSPEKKKPTSKALSARRAANKTTCLSACDWKRSSPAGREARRPHVRLKGPKMPPIDARAIESEMETQTLPALPHKPSTVFQYPSFGRRRSRADWTALAGRAGSRERTPRSFRPTSSVSTRRTRASARVLNENISHLTRPSFILYQKRWRDGLPRGRSNRGNSTIGSAWNPAPNSSLFPVVFLSKHTNTRTHPPLPHYPLFRLFRRFFWSPYLSGFTCLRVFHLSTRTQPPLHWSQIQPFVFRRRTVPREESFLY